jgi:ABC-type polysaccharide/polyol phosphate export permease
MWALVVRSLREETGGAAVGFLKGVLMALAFCLIFYVFMTFFRLTGLTVRGDLMVFILIGVGFFFAMKFTMIAAMQAMQSSWKMAAHPHLSPILFVYADSLGVFYNWFLAICLIFIGNSLVTGRMELEHPIMFFPIFFLTWLTGMALGMVLGFLMFYFSWFMMVKRILFKIMFFTSGKFTNANLIPADLLWIFKLNPLFHLIDQMRDAAFVNYEAHHTNMVYPTLFCFALLLAGHILYDYMLRRRNVMSG